MTPTTPGQVADGAEQGQGGSACVKGHSGLGPGLERMLSNARRQPFCLLRHPVVFVENDGGYCRQILILKGKSVNLRTMLLSEGHSPYSPSEQLDLA